MDEIKTTSELIDEIADLDAEIEIERAKLEQMPVDPMRDFLAGAALAITQPIEIEQPLESTRLSELKRKLFHLERENAQLRTELEGHRYLNCGELADALGKHRNYITHMKASGFPMPGNRATLSEARRWLIETGFTRHSGVKKGASKELYKGKHIAIV